MRVKVRERAEERGVNALGCRCNMVMIARMVKEKEEKSERVAMKKRGRERNRGRERG